LGYPGSFWSVRRWPEEGEGLLEDADERGIIASEVTFEVEG